MLLRFMKAKKFNFLSSGRFSDNNGEVLLLKVRIGIQTSRNFNHRKKREAWIRSFITPCSKTKSNWQLTRDESHRTNGDPL